MSSSLATPPLATTGRSVRSHTARSSFRLGPVNVPSLVTSVTTYRAQPSLSSRARTSHRSPPCRVHPRAASVVPRTSRPTATLSPYRAIAPAVQSGFSRAAVPMLTRAHPVAKAASSDSSSRMPPETSTATSSRPTTSAIKASFEPRPNAASRSTKWIHSAPCRLPRQRSVKRFAEDRLGPGLALHQPHRAARGNIDGRQQHQPSHEPPTPNPADRLERREPTWPPGPNRPVWTHHSSPKTL